MAKHKIKNIEIPNKKAGFLYELLDKYTAGVVLYGTEIKSIRAGKVSFVVSYCFFIKNELYVRGINIAEYWWGNINNHNPRRDRKLLLTSKELLKLFQRSKEKGLTIVPTKLFINDNGYAKIIISIARGKKIYDKREAIKERDMKRSMDLD